MNYEKHRIFLQFHDWNSVLDTINQLSIAMVNNCTPKIFIEHDYNNSSELKDIQNDLVETALILIHLLRQCKNYLKMDKETQESTETMFYNLHKTYVELTYIYLEKLKANKKI